MFVRTASAFLCILFAFATLAAAIPKNRRWDTTSATPIPATTTVTVTAAAPTVTVTVDQCNTGSVQCCNVVTQAGSPLGNLLLGLLGIVVSDLDVLLGADCTPLSIGEVLGGATCSATPVCCEDNSVDTLISIGCIVIIL
ncbi:hypothetical protein NM688_g7001 [Phlebia brevispora]|uniref:Uncharacterized protein n=1 Tax=Phlebia brevispora TaxID=194682 RepID=A0ACC1SA13_9APHY|nr:hypothetical protein NM688_g7001 [Phlebia brevispora]